MNEGTIHKYLEGTATTEEKKEILFWLQESAQNRYYFFELKAIWCAKKQLTTNNDQLEISLAKLNDKIDATENQIKQKQQRSFYLRILTGVASMILLGILLNFTIFSNSDISTGGEIVQNRLVASNFDKDSIKTVTLADGTLVWLSENSSLTYPADFTDAERTVQLEGEAFFEVTSDATHPFIVETDVNRVYVLGTSFSVNTSYNDKNEVILIEGSVQLQRPDGINLINLRPGQKALYTKDSHSLEVNEIDLKNFSSWKYGLITLSNASIQTILNCIRETYGVDVIMNISPLQGRRYHFSFKRSRGVEEALRQLSFMTGTEAKVSL